MEGLCECGCGQPTKVAVRTIKRLGKVEGQPQRFILGHYDPLRRSARRGEVRSPETRLRISKATRGKRLGNQNARGHKWSSEKRIRMETRKPRGPIGPEERQAISERQRGALSSSWKGGIHMHDGYRLVRAIGHPFAGRHGYVAEHRLVMERVIGRYLLPREEVHHRNRDKADNRASNLIYCASHSDHMRRHHADEIAVQSALATLRQQRPELLAPGA
jgi:hypothetical protein